MGNLSHVSFPFFQKFQYNKCLSPQIISISTSQCWTCSSRMVFICEVVILELEEHKFGKSRWKVHGIHLKMVRDSTVFLHISHFFLIATQNVMSKVRCGGYKRLFIHNVTHQMLLKFIARIVLFLFFWCWNLLWGSNFKP